VRCERGRSFSSRSPVVEAVESVMRWWCSESVLFSWFGAASCVEGGAEEEEEGWRCWCGERFLVEIDYNVC